MDDLVRTYCPNKSSCRTSAEAVRVLLDNLEGYYGSLYNKVQREVLAGYLLDSDPRELGQLYAQVLKVKLYGRPLPLVEHFEEAHEAVIASRPMYAEYRPLAIEAETCMDRGEMSRELEALYERIREKGREVWDKKRAGKTGGVVEVGEVRIGMRMCGE